MSNLELSNFIYLEEKKLIFAYVPKAACTNWKCILRRLKGYDNYLDGRLSHHPHNSGLSKLSQVKDPWCLLGDESIAKYTFIRNPYTRILSAYLNKIKPFSLPHAKPEWDRYYYNLYGKLDEYRKTHHPESEYVDFNCFLNWIKSDLCMETKDEHWRPYSHLIGPNPELFDYIGRFENIHEDSRVLLEKMGCDVPFPSQADIAFNPTHASKAQDVYYGDREREIVRLLYHEDFSNYGYEP